MFFIFSNSLELTKSNIFREINNNIKNIGSIETMTKLQDNYKYNETMTNLPYSYLPS